MMNAGTPYTLPNGLVIHHHRAYETDFVYREVFVDEVYTRHFDRLPPQPCVVDVGANIGLFSLFIRERYPGCTVHAFEPSPVHFALLQQNLADDHGRLTEGIHLHRQGLGERAARLVFTYYPDYSLLSGFHGDSVEDRKLLGAGIAEQMKLHGKPNADRYLDLLIDRKLDHVEQIECEVIPLSEVIDREHLGRIDLLKIDAEKAELDVLNGIRSSHWPLVQRLVIEVHGSDICREATALLVAQGFQVESEKNADFNEARLFTLRAKRPGDTT